MEQILPAAARSFRIPAIPAWLFAALLGLGSSLVLVSAAPAARRLPAPEGPHPAGRVVYDWTDQHRVDTLAPEGSGHREILVWIWYPAASSEGTRAPYLPETWARALEAEHGLLRFLFQDYSKVEGYSHSAVPLDRKDAPYPLIILSTGYGQVPAYYTALAEDLASRGYVVAGIANTYSAPVVVFPDGREVHRSIAGSLPEKGSAQQESAAGDALVAVWAADINFVIDRLTALNQDKTSLFHAAIDLTEIGAAGHSFGGAASAEASMSDHRIKAVADLDGTLFGHAAARGVRVPFLIMTSAGKSKGSDEEQSSFAASLRAGSGSEAVEVTVDGSRHFNFTDFSVLYAPMYHVMGALGRIDGSRAIHITRTYVAAFLDHYLKGASAALLEGPSPDFPEVVFHTK